MTKNKALQLALEALEQWNTPLYKRGTVIKAIKEALETKDEFVSMRMPKVGDRVVCLEDESLGVVHYLTAGGSPEIRFDDGSHGTYLLREFAELFGYADTTSQSETKDEPKCVAIVEVFEKDWRLDYMSLPVGKHKLYAQHYTYDTTPQRTWVGLTNDDMSFLFPHGKSVWVQEIVKIIENKLKEKNGFN